MSDAKQKVMSLLGATAAVGVSTVEAGATYEVFEAPANHYAIVDHVIVHSNSASLAGWADANFGAGAAGEADPWVQEETGLVDCTTANEYYIIRQDSNNVLMIDGDDATVANRKFNMEVVDGATAGGTTAICEAWGHLIAK